jgi:hypothetical protein
MSILTEIYLCHACSDYETRSTSFFLGSWIPAADFLRSSAPRGLYGTMIRQGVTAAQAYLAEVCPHPLTRPTPACINSDQQTVRAAAAAAGLAIPPTQPIMSAACRVVGVRAWLGRSHAALSTSRPINLSRVASSALPPCCLPAMDSDR